MKSYRKGITIIEVVVSMMIAGFVLVGMLQLYSLGAAQSNLARHKVMAVNIAQAEIESLVSATYEGITLSNYPMTKTVKIDTGKTDNASDDINGTMITSISNVSEGYKVTVDISWTDYYGAMSEVLTSTITSYL
ncbi:MAG: type II secretion system protein [Candidatus Omnitrophica bacterium]|nr:type II secretion system protein [Candidatus Omnitrophota bacterium]